MGGWDGGVETIWRGLGRQEEMVAEVRVNLMSWGWWWGSED